MTDITYHLMPDGRRIAYRFLPGAAPAILFLPGYLSDMGGFKAAAVFAWARAEGRACLLLDYSGCGASSGDFADGTLTRWREEVLALITALRLPRLILVGSSMGGWLMLLLAMALQQSRAATVAGLLGIAAAPDFTDWGFGAEEKAALAAGRVIHRANPYGPEPTPTHPLFWADGQAQCLLQQGTSPAGHSPMRLLQGRNDPDVPWQVALRLAEIWHSGDVHVTLIKDGDHRLSRPADIALILRVLADMITAEESRTV